MGIQLPMGCNWTEPNRYDQVSEMHKAGSRKPGSASKIPGGLNAHLSLPFTADHALAFARCLRCLLLSKG